MSNDKNKKEPIDSYVVRVVADYIRRHPVRPVEIIGRSLLHKAIRDVSCEAQKCIERTQIRKEGRLIGLKDALVLAEEYSSKWGGSHWEDYRTQLRIMIEEVEEPPPVFEFETAESAKYEGESHPDVKPVWPKEGDNDEWLTSIEDDMEDL